VNTCLKTLFLSIMMVLVCFLAMPSAFAKSSTILGSRSGQTQAEINACTDTTNYISSCSSAALYSTRNLFGTQTNSSSVYSAAYGFGHYYSISFNVGHGYYLSDWDLRGWPWQWHEHWQYRITADDGSHIYDCDIYDNSAYQNTNSHKFAFLWDCEQGDEIGNMITYPCGEVKARGMPLAWLHTTSLSSNGYSNPDGGNDTFIGFDGIAPWLSDPYLGVNESCKKFLHFFYEAALMDGYHNSINDALNVAAQSVWDVETFEGCFLDGGYYGGRMVVYGNGGRHISSVNGGGGGSCPTLFVWNGTNYAEEGLLNIHADSDITIRWNIKNTPILKNNFYSLKLKELDNFTSHVDQVKLYAIDKRDRLIMCPLVCADHSEFGDVTAKLLFNDEKRVNLTPTQSVNLRFLPRIPQDKISHFIFEINGFNQKTP